MKPWCFLAAWLLCLQACAQIAWYELAPFPGTPRDDAAAFTIGFNAYVGTGMEVGWGLTNDWWRFNWQSSQQWSPAASLPASPRQYCAAAQVSGMGYLFGGIDAGGALNELWRYDAMLDQWTQLPALPGEGRYAANAVALADGRLLICYGMLGSGSPTREAWLFDTDAQTWQQLPDAPAPARHRALSGPGSLIAGGMDGDGNVLSDAWFVELSGSSLPAWSPLPDLPAPRFGGRTFFPLVLCGASAWSVFHDDAWALGSSAWTPTPSFPGGPRRGAVLTEAYGGFGLLFGLGLDGTMTRRNDWWLLMLGTGVPEAGAESAVVVPNPTAGALHVALHGLGTSASFTIVSPGGEACMAGRLNASAWIDASSLAPGAYCIALSDGARRTVARFIKLP